MTYILQGDSEGMTRAADLLRAGKLVAFGTKRSTAGCRRDNPTLWASIFEAKGRRGSIR
jgi:tRNA A37 threonylcarbamoyladenosine synthetase subunit TsaC/SUA5/YrdC